MAIPRNQSSIFNNNDSRTASSLVGGSVNQLSTNPGLPNIGGQQQLPLSGIANTESAFFSSIDSWVPVQSKDTTNTSDAKGRRVRLRPKPAAAAKVYGPSSSLQGKILTNTGGMVWPYQPTIQYQQEVSYQPIETVHTNQEFYAYQGTKAPKFTVDGQWTVQSQKEGLYTLACIRFLQTVTKMYFGTNNQGLEGTPPPVLLFDAYGQNMFNCLPVIVTGYNISLPNDVDYIAVDLDKFNEQFNIANQNKLTQELNKGKDTNNVAWLPAVFTIQVSLTVQNTPRKLREFDLDKFRTGDLIRNGGWI